MRNIFNALLVLGLCGTVALRADHFVAQNGQEPVWPYTNLNTAASNIRALHAAADGATVWVDDGVYYTPPQSFRQYGTNVVSITNAAITLRSINGPAAAIINGGGSNESALISLSPRPVAPSGRSLLDGFTHEQLFLYTRAASKFTVMTTRTGIVRNCVISGNVVASIPLRRRRDVSYNNVGFQPVISNCLVREQPGGKHQFFDQYLNP